MIKSHLVPITEYHACPNDCILYRGAHIDAAHCPKCGEERFSDRGIPKKRSKYLSLGSRIKRYFGNESISKLLQSHSTTAMSDDVHDIHQTTTWKEWYSQGGIFGGDCRGLSMTLCLDGT